MAKTKASEGIGPKIGRLRKKKSISLEHLAEKTGMAVDYLARIESGEELPPVGDILRISRVLTIDPGMLLESGRGRDKSLEKKRIEDFKKRESSYFYTVLTPGAGSKHLRAFRVIIPPRSEHPRINYRHEGEEFVYVLDGELEITVGQKKHHLKQAGSIHFDSGINHALKNTGDKETVLIVTVYTP